VRSCFVDYASGQTVPVIDRHTGEFQPMQVFVDVLGTSSYTVAEATRSQKLSDWLSSHAHCFAFLGGVLEIVMRYTIGCDKRKIKMGRSAMLKSHSKV